MPSAETADAIYDRISERLATDAYRPRALYERFGITVLATTDDPSSDLSAHAALAADPTWSGRVIPTFRPDRYLEPGRRGWVDAVAELGKAADLDTGDFAGFVRALEARRRYFVAHGAVSADHSHDDVRTDPLEPSEAARIYRVALAADASEAEATALRRHLLLEMARMSCDDGLVMTLHPAVRRGHHGPTTERFGPDTGNDIPIRVEFTDALRPLLERYGTHPGLPPGGVHHRRDRLLPRARPPGRLLPVGVRRRALVVHRRPARHPALPGGGHRDRRVLPDLRVHRRHPRVLLDPRAPRPVPPGRRGLARHAGGRAPARRGRGAGHRGRAGHHPARRRCSSCDRDATISPAALPRRRRRPGGRPRAPGPPRAGQLLPRPPGLVHRPRPGRSRLGCRRVHRPQRETRRARSPPRTASTP